jgi:hypothetical protein
METQQRGAGHSQWNVWRLCRPAVVCSIAILHGMRLQEETGVWALASLYRAH